MSDLLLDMSDPLLDISDHLYNSGHMISLLVVFLNVAL